MYNDIRVKQLSEKWYDFDSYTHDDYREIFNREDLWIDDVDGDCIVIGESSYIEGNLMWAMEQIVNDIADAGFKCIAMSGFTLTPNEWLVEIKRDLAHSTITYHEGFGTISEYDEEAFLW